MRFLSVFATFSLVFCLQANAQFYRAGDNPASVKWMSVESDNYRIIYPSGLDSLARSYAAELEKYRIPVSRSIGYVPGEMIRGKMPVVLHAFNSYSNGSVAWAPKRMDLYTSPQAYSADPLPWKTMLAVHESRHVAQMQFGLSYCFEPFKYVFGEMFAGGMAGIYPDMWLLEGDAVVTETALTSSGRGRVGTFLNRYRIAFDEGDFRNPARWAYGSNWKYTPDHYAFGYMTISGIRYLYDTPYFAKDLFENYAKRPYDIFARNSVSKRISGKNFRSLSRETMELYHGIWKEDSEARAPFMHLDTLGRHAKVHTEYEGSIASGDAIYSLKSSFNSRRRLIKTEGNGKEKVISPFGSDVERLYRSPVTGKIIWSETVPDMRWSLKNNSAIRYFDPGSGKSGTLVNDGRMYYPCPSPDDTRISVTEYTDDGRSVLVILDGVSGKREHVSEIPDSLQLVETSWLDGHIYFTAISEHGYGIYRTGIPGGKENGNDRSSVIETAISPLPVMIFNLAAHGRSVMFISDRNGTCEIYSLNPSTGEIFQESNTKYGISDFCVSADGNSLICSVFDRTGTPLARVGKDSLLNRKVDFHDRFVWKVADRLSEQERAVAEKAGTAIPDSVKISDPERYRKFPHLFNLHSWAPMFFNYDRIKNSSYDQYYEMSSAGAVAYFQNRLGTFHAMAGYSAHEDPDGKERWRHSGHVNFSYSGLFPVLEAELDFNDRAAHVLEGYRTVDETGETSTTYAGRISDGIYMKGKISAYIPFNFSSGGRSRGLIPKISWEMSNDIYDSSLFLGKMEMTGSDKPVMIVTGRSSGERRYFQAVSANIRYYSVLSAATSEVYPEWGFGAEAGTAFNPGLGSMISPSAYLYAYGYVPGLFGNQGIRLSGIYGMKLSGSRPFSNGINALPRGFGSFAQLKSLASSAPFSARITADYAIPFPMGDFNIGNLFYVSRGILTPHFDYSFIGKRQLWSAGATLAVEFRNFFGLAFPMSCGITYSRNGGPDYSGLEQGGIKLGRNYFGPVFSVSF